MSPKPAPKFEIPRRTAVSQDEAFRELETRIESRGNGIAGQSALANAHLDVQTPIQTSERTSTKDAPTSDKAIVKRRGGRLRRRRTIYLPTDLDTQLTRFCNASGREVSETVAAALELYLASKR